jgi:hypothetical protein
MRGSGVDEADDRCNAAILGRVLQNAAENCFALDQSNAGGICVRKNFMVIIRVIVIPIL